MRNVVFQTHGKNKLERQNIKPNSPSQTQLEKIPVEHDQRKETQVLWSHQTTSVNDEKHPGRENAMKKTTRKTSRSVDR